MRMLPTHYMSKAEPALLKKKRAQIAHLVAPLKGLSESTRFSAGDAQTATILSNFVIEDDRIKCRAGYRKVSTRGSAPVWKLIPWYGSVPAMAAASNNELWNAQNGNLIKGGFTGNDWHWTSFSNLGARDFTVLVNGANGVWSWDGGLTSTDPAPVAVTNLSKSNPAVCTVAAGDISKFSNGMVVQIAGAAGTGMVEANGPQLIVNVGAPANTFTLVSVDTSTASAPQTSGVTADPPGTGIVKELVTGPTYEPWVVPDQFQLVLSHMNRLWFADSSNLSVYYLPLMQKSGEVRTLPLNVLFKRGGSIRAMYTWTVDGGAGMDDQLVIFSTNGECVIYSGTDPDNVEAWRLVGVFRFDSPMGKDCVVQYGGDLYVLISTGLVPMSTLLRAETDHLGQGDRNVVSMFLRDAIAYRGDIGWQAFLNPSTGRLFCNIPLGAENRYSQLIRHMPKGAVWTQFKDVPSRCWGWVDPFVYFGDDKGNVYEMHPQYYNDAGKEITVDVQMAWNNFNTPAKKHFNVIQAYITTTGTPHPLIDMKVDYDFSPAWNEPDLTSEIDGAFWDEATWDVDYWASGERGVTIWNGISPLGHVGAVRVTARIANCSFSITGFDVVFETGVFGP